MLGWVLAAQAGAVTLDEAWRAADANPLRQASAAEAERSAAQVGAARAALLPKVAASAAWQVQDEEITLDPSTFLPPAVLALTGPTDPFVVQPQQWGQASATLVLPVVDVDGWLQLAAARHARDAGAADDAAAVRALRLGVARALYGAAMAREAEEVTDEAVAVARRGEEIARARVGAGEVPARVALEAEGARLAAERDRAAAREARIRAEEALHRLTGLPRDAPVALGPAPAPAPRPEVAAAEARSAAAEAARRAVGAGWVPDVTASGTALVTGNPGFAPNDVFLVGKVEATWTFDGGYRLARAREAGAQAAAARALAEAVSRQVVEDVAVADAARERAETALAAAGREREAAEARLAAAEDAFGAGLVPFADLERAALARSAAALAESRERWSGALVAAERALAGT